MIRRPPRSTLFPYTDALPIFRRPPRLVEARTVPREDQVDVGAAVGDEDLLPVEEDRKSTRLNSSHLVISYAVFCLKKKNRDGASTPRVSDEPHETVVTLLLHD